jgi:hypothetical protein
MSLGWGWGRVAAAAFGSFAVLTLQPGTVKKKTMVLMRKINEIICFFCIVLSQVRFELLGFTL